MCHVPRATYLIIIIYMIYNIYIYYDICQQPYVIRYDIIRTSTVPGSYAIIFFDVSFVLFVHLLSCTLILLNSPFFLLFRRQLRDRVLHDRVVYPHEVLYHKLCFQSFNRCCRGRFFLREHVVQKKQFALRTGGQASG